MTPSCAVAPTCRVDVPDDRRILVRDRSEHEDLHRPSLLVPRTLRPPCCSGRATCSGATGVVHRRRPRDRLHAGCNSRACEGGSTVSAPMIIVRQAGRPSLHLALHEPLEVGRDCPGLLLADRQTSRQTPPAERRGRLRRGDRSRLHQRHLRRRAAARRTPPPAPRSAGALGRHDDRARGRTGRARRRTAPR